MDQRAGSDFDGVDNQDDDDLQEEIDDDDDDVVENTDNILGELKLQD